MKLTWKRIGKLSGPGNILNDRWEVFGGRGCWLIRDQSRYAKQGGILEPSYQTMRAAKAAAEKIAQEA